MNPNNERHMDRLSTAWDWSRNRIEIFREHRRLAVESYLGTHYSDRTLTDPSPVNLIAQAINIYTRYLFGGEPRVMVTAKIPQADAFARRFSMMMKGLMKRMCFADRMRDVVTDSLFSPFGIAKVGLQQPRVPDPQRPEAGDPFCERVDLDDWCHDMAASRWSEVEYCGDEYLLPLDEVKENKRYDKAIRESLQAETARTRNSDGTERVQDIGSDGWGSMELLTDNVKMRDVWIPRDRQLLVIAVQKPDKPLEIIDWEGPEIGPYHRLRYFDIPSKTMPMPPVATLMDLNLITNQLFTRAVDGALMEKDVVGVGREAAEDANRIRSSPNYEWVTLDRPDLIKRVQVGGVSQSALAMGIQTQQWFNTLAGNLDALGGLSPGASTLGQDQMLTETASRLVNHMQERVIDFVREVCRDLTWYLWHNQNGAISVVEKYPEKDYVVDVTPDDRVGGYFDYLFDIAPYTMQSRTPKMRMQAVMQWLQNVIMPAAPIFAQSGWTLNGNELVKMIEEFDDLPEIKKILSKIDPAIKENPQDQQGMPKPAVTKRTYERVNTPGRTQRGANYALTQALMGNGIQESEAQAAAGAQ